MIRVSCVVEDGGGLCRVVYILPEVGMLTTLVYKLAGKCEERMKTEKRSDLERLVCPTSRKQAVPCRFEFRAVCNRTDDDVSIAANSHRPSDRRVAARQAVWTESATVCGSVITRSHRP